jgi:ABC-type Fe3+/spermidine/putrescine transport system ATPase subunit
MLSVKNLGKKMRDFTLRDVSFDVQDGDYFVLLGPSGVGKTVLLELLAGLITPDEGQVLWNSEDITYERIHKRRMGLVYQDQALFPHMTVRKNIAYGLKTRKLSPTEISDRVEALAEDVGISDLLHRYPETLSGGEAQRVALARTLATEPRCLLLDEPLSAMDTRSRTELQALLRSLHRKGHTVIHVTHENKEAMALATQVAIMDSGSVTQVGTPDDVFHHPKSEFVARFVGIRNSLMGQLHASADGSLPRFESNGLTFHIDTDAAAGEGHLVFRSEDVRVVESGDAADEMNHFKGVVTDIAPARMGSELTIDIGVDIVALVAAEAMNQMKLDCGHEVWVSLNADAARYIEL